MSHVKQPSNKNRRNKVPIAQAEEIFVQEILKGRSQRHAYIAAYPDRANLAPNGLDTQACLLWKKKHIKERYKEILAKVSEEETRKTLWTREESILNLKEIIRVNMQDIERNSQSLETELTQLYEQLIQHPENAKSIQLAIQKNQRTKRTSTVNNKGVLDAIAELNKMLGFAQENLNVNGGTIVFTGETVLSE